MSDDEPRRGTADDSNDHLTDEDLSAALDGVGPAGTDAHLAGCASCGARSDALGSARAVAATAPPAPTAARRDAAVAAALDVAQEGAPRPAISVSPGPATTGDLAALRSRRRSRPRRDIGPWLGVAAVLLLLVGAASLLDLSGSDSDDAATSAVEDSASSSTGGDSSAAGEAGRTESAEAEPDGSAAATAPDATEEEVAADREEVADDGDAATEDEVPAAVGGDAGPEPIDVGDLGAIEPAADLTDLSRLLRRYSDEASAGASTTVDPVPADPRAGSAEECLEEVRAALEVTDPLALIGTATVDGAPATVLGFDVGADTGIRIAVVGVDCGVLGVSPSS